MLGKKYSEKYLIVPLWEAIISKDMDTPKPVPCFFVVKNGSEIFFKFSSSIPVPLSSTTISI